MPKGKKKERSYPLSAVVAALDAIDLPAAKRAHFLEVLEREKPKRGHPFTDDDAMKAQGLKLMRQGLKPYSAAKRVTEALPQKSLRDAAFKRLYRKLLAERGQLAAEHLLRSQASGSGMRPLAPLDHYPQKK